MDDNRFENVRIMERKGKALRVQFRKQCEKEIRERHKKTVTDVYQFVKVVEVKPMPKCTEFFKDAEDENPFLATFTSRGEDNIPNCRDYEVRKTLTGDYRRRRDLWECKQHALGIEEYILAWERYIKEFDPEGKIADKKRRRANFRWLNQSTIPEERPSRVPKIFRQIGDRLMEYFGLY